MQFADGETDVGLPTRRKLTLKQLAFGVDDRSRLKRVSWITFSRSSRAVDQMTPGTGQPLSRERSELRRAWTGFDLPLMFVQTIATEKDANRDRLLHE